MGAFNREGGLGMGEFLQQQSVNRFSKYRKWEDTYYLYRVYLAEVVTTLPSFTHSFTQ